MVSKPLAPVEPSSGGHQMYVHWLRPEFLEFNLFYYLLNSGSGSLCLTVARRLQPPSPLKTLLRLFLASSFAILLHSSPSSMNRPSKHSTRTVYISVIRHSLLSYYWCVLLRLGTVTTLASVWKMEAVLPPDGNTLCRSKNSSDHYTPLQNLQIFKRML